jgi:hypothetical protein
MGYLPILKPREVVALLEALGLANFDNEVHISSFATLMTGVQQCRFMLDVCVTYFASANRKRYWFDG